MTKQVHGQTGAHAPLSRRDFLTRAGLTVGAAAAAAAVPGAAYAVPEGVIGDWALRARCPRHGITSATSAWWARAAAA